MAPLKPINAPGVLARAQIDLISLEVDAKAGGTYKFIGQFIDLFSKYQKLFRLKLKYKSAEIVSKKLNMYVFKIFGLLHILQPDNGKSLSITLLMEWFCNDQEGPS